MKLKLPKELATVTRTSKILAAIVFITLPFLGFFLGTNYQASLDSASQTTANEPILVKRVPTPTPSQSIDTSNWKTYTNNDYSLKYPIDWKLSKMNYLNSVNLTNTNSTVAIIISEGQYPYGFSDSGKSETQNLNIKVDKDYQVKEIILNNSSAFVDFKIDTRKNHHVLFGTGYPAGEDSKASLSDYRSSLNTIIQILSTFQFTN